MGTPARPTRQAPRLQHGRAPVPGRPRARPRTPVTVQRKVLVVDSRNMLILWLEEKIARGELTPAQADAMLHEQGSQIKNWVAPLKDAAGSGKLVYKLARDFASWKGARVYFTKSRAGHDLVVFKGWPAGRKLITGTRYRLSHPKIIELQIGKPGLRAAAKESARFGIWLVVAVDIADYILRDKATFGQLLGLLTVDIPSVLIASAIGAAAGSAAAGVAIVGTIAVGPFLVAFLVGVAVGLALYSLDEHFKIGERLGVMYDRGLDRLDDLWDELGDQAEARYRQLANSSFVNDLHRDARDLHNRIARQADIIRGEIQSWW